MTPLHILACSSVHNLEAYHLLVEQYPENLITVDRWGATPLLYAFWGAAPDEIIQFLVDSYQLLYPGHQFNWTAMVETLGSCDTPKENIEKVLHVRQMHFPEQSIDWEYLLDVFVRPFSNFSFLTCFQEQMQFLVTCGIAARVENLAFKVWRDYVTHMIQTSNFVYQRDNSLILHRIRDKIAYFADELPKLKEVSSILELALWKMKINDTSHQQKLACHQKKIKSDESSIRQQCRVTCGADILIGHVMPYLIST
jgi:hypothetical protein